MTVKYLHQTFLVLIAVPENDNQHQVVLASFCCFQWVIIPVIFRELFKHCEVLVHEVVVNDFIKFQYWLWERYKNASCFGNHYTKLCLVWSSPRLVFPFEGGCSESGLERTLLSSSSTTAFSSSWIVFDMLFWNSLWDNCVGFQKSFNNFIFWT